MYRLMFCGRVERVAAERKTIAAKVLIARTILLAPPDMQPVKTIIIDPKAGEDFVYDNSYRGEDSALGLQRVFDIFQKRKTGEDKSRNLIIAFCDEFQSLVNLLPAKAKSKDDDTMTKDEAQRILSILVSLSRSYRISIQLATQQPSAQIFGGSGAREQFGVLACLFGENGGAGAETLSMMFDAESRERIKTYGAISGRGGFASINGGLAVPVRVPKIQHFQRLDDVISGSVMK
jgi:hypothetical protein